MNRFVFMIIMFVFFSQALISQSIDHGKQGGHFFKSSEYNVAERGEKLGHPRYNLERKPIFDRIFFSDTNSFVEFIVANPPSKADSVMAFRIVKDQNLASYKLEIMQTQNGTQLYFATKDILRKKTEIVMPDEWLSKIPIEIQDSIRKHNEEAALYKLTDYDNELFRYYLVPYQEYPISVELSEKLHDTMATLIHNFKADGIPRTGFLGYPLEVTFRCVVGDEVWTLKIMEPQRRALLLSGICTQIINDALNNEINESKYLKQLTEL